MKILFVIHGFPPHSSYGAENYVYGLARHLSAEHDVFVFHRVGDASRGEYATEEYDYEGLHVFTINNTFKQVKGFADTYRNDAIARTFGEYLDRVRPDVVHFHHVTCLSTTCIEEAHKRGIPVFYTLHDFWLFCPRGQFLTRDLAVCNAPKNHRCVFCNAYQLGLPSERVQRIYGGLPDAIEPGGGILRRIAARIRRARAHRAFAHEENETRLVEERAGHIAEMCGYVRAFIAPSRFMREKAIESGLPEDRVIFSRNGYNHGLFAGFRRERAGGVRFGFIGSLIPSKGAHILIRAFRRVRRVDAQLKIFGASYDFEGYPGYDEKLRKAAAGDGRIDFAGRFDNTKIAGVFAQIDVLVVPSIWYENAPLTIEEAILTRTPLIVSGIGGMKERIDEVGGLTFHVGREKALAGKMSLLAAEPEMLEHLRPDPSHAKTVVEQTEEILRIYSA